jgi:hypothetical protein
VPDHIVSSFACGKQALDDWLKRRALANQSNGASRTFVVVDGQHYGISASPTHLMTLMRKSGKSNTLFYVFGLVVIKYGY